MKRNRLRTVALLGREAGLRTLEEALVPDRRLDVAAVFTHKWLPEADGGGLRPEFVRYEHLCRAAGVPIYALDGEAAEHGLIEALPEGQFDMLISCQWDAPVAPQVLARVEHAALNLYQGELAEGGEAEPVQAAIQRGADRVAITAHKWLPNGDAGAVLEARWLPISAAPRGLNPAYYSEVVAGCMLPHYAPLLRQVIDGLLQPKPEARAMAPVALDSPPPSLDEIAQPELREPETALSTREPGGLVRRAFHQVSPTSEYLS